MMQPLGFPRQILRMGRISKSRNPSPFTRQTHLPSSYRGPNRARCSTIEKIQNVHNRNSSKTLIEILNREEFEARFETRVDLDDIWPSPSDQARITWSFTRSGGRNRDPWNLSLSLINGPLGEPIKITAMKPKHMAWLTDVLKAAGTYGVGWKKMTEFSFTDADEITQKIPLK